MDWDRGVEVCADIICKNVKKCEWKTEFKFKKNGTIDDIMIHTNVHNNLYKIIDNNVAKLTLMHLHWTSK